MRIGIVLSHGFAARELLYSCVASALQEAGHEVLLLVASKLVPDVTDWATTRSMEVISIDDHGLWREYYWHQFRKQLFLRHRPTAIVRINNDRLRREHPIINGLFALGTKLLLGRPKLQSLHCALERTIYRTPQLSQRIRDLGLDLVVVTTPGLYFADLRVLRAIRRARSRSMCVLLSWDIPTTKGLFAERVDRWTVWGEAGCHEVIDLHQYRPEQIEICGAAHFDVYATPWRFGRREELLRDRGLDVEAKTILIGLGPSVYYQDQPGLVRDLVFTLKRLDVRTQVICRLHPQFASSDFITVLRALLGEGGLPFYLDVPKLHKATVDGQVQEQDAIELARVLWISDVTLNIASTLTLDALALDKPVINIGYDVNGVPQVSGYPAATLYDYPHYSKIVRTGAVKVAYSREEMEGYTVEYLNNPSLDSEQRRHAVSKFLYKVDGHSKDRIADAIIGFAALCRS